jgi:transposase
VLLIGLHQGTILLADRGQDADWIRKLASQKGARASIPPKRSQATDLLQPRARNLVDRFFNAITQYRRIATRYDKLAVDYLAFVKLASIRLWLRVLSPRPSRS